VFSDNTSDFGQNKRFLAKEVFSEKTSDLTKLFDLTRQMFIDITSDNRQKY
jgi:hypothetical protein